MIKQSENRSHVLRAFFKQTELYMASSSTILKIPSWVVLSPQKQTILLSNYQRWSKYLSQGLHCKFMLWLEVDSGFHDWKTGWTAGTLYIVRLGCTVIIYSSSWKKKQIKQGLLGGVNVKNRENHGSWRTCSLGWNIQYIWWSKAYPDGTPSHSLFP